MRRHRGQTELTHTELTRKEDLMSLHSLLWVTIGVPNVDETAAYYADFAA